MGLPSYFGFVVANGSTAVGPPGICAVCGRQCPGVDAILNGPKSLLPVTDRNVRDRPTTVNLTGQQANILL